MFIGVHLWFQVPSAFAQGAAAAPEAGAPLEVARIALEQARDTQSDIIKLLADLNDRRQRSASTNELLNTLSAIHQMQTAMVRNIRGMMGRTFGQSLEALAEEDRHAIDQLAVDERTVRRRLADWMIAFTQHTTGDDVPQAMRILHDRATDSPAGDLMEQSVQQIEENHLSEAAATGQKAADEITRLLQALEMATADPADLRDKRIRTLREIVDRERRVRSRLASETLTPVDWQRLRREQTDVTELTRLMTFEETGIPVSSLEYIREGHHSMENARKQIRKRQSNEAIQSIDAAIRSLEQAIEALEAAGLSDMSDMPEMPPVKRRPLKPGGMPATMGHGGAGVDVSPVAQLAADIALVTKLRRLQARLHAETVGRTPPKPLPAGAQWSLVAAGRQQSYAAQLPQVIRRVELCITAAASVLEEARVAMAESAERLRASDKKGSAARQEVALDRLAFAEAQLRQFFKELLETLAMISNVPGQAPAHGGAGEEEKAKTTLFLTMFREIVRIGRMMKDQTALIARAEDWAASSPDTIDPQAVAAGANKQRELSKLAFDILEVLKPMPGEVVSSLPEAVLEAGQWMQGAADMLDVSKFNTALERQRIAMEFLENAWTVMAQSMATLREGRQSDDAEQKDRKGEPKMSEGDGIGATAEAGTAQDKPWYWNLPPRARDAISQSLAQPLPPKYEAAIRRYYERLSHRTGSER